jgi:hypothetical protein
MLNAESQITTTFGSALNLQAIICQFSTHLITESGDRNCRHRAMVLQKSMSDTRFSLASVPTVNSTWLLTNDESTLMIPCIVTPALQQGEVPYTACDLSCKSHHSALFFCFTIWAKFHVCLHCQGPGSYLTTHRSPLPAHAMTRGQARTKKFTVWWVCLSTSTSCYSLSYSYSHTMTQRGLNGKTLSNTVLYHYKVTLNVHYIEK